MCTIYDLMRFNPLMDTAPKSVLNMTWQTFQNTNPPIATLCAVYVSMHSRLFHFTLIFKSRLMHRRLYACRFPYARTEPHA